MKKPTRPHAPFLHWAYFALLVVSACHSEIPCVGDDNCVPSRDESDTVVKYHLDCSPPVAGSLRINEILADPNGYDINGDQWPDPFEDEFVEVINMAPIPISLQGVSIRVGSRYPHRFQARCLPPGEALVVFGGGYEVPTTNGTVIADHSLKIPNLGGAVALIGMHDLLLDSVTYGEEADGPHSLTRVPDGSDTWQIHPGFLGAGAVTHSAGLCMNGGTFPLCTVPDSRHTEDDDTCRPVGPNELVINEVLSDPGHRDANGDGATVWYQDEFIELVLTTTGPRQLDGLSVQVNDRPRHQFSETCLQPKTGLVLFAGGHPALSETIDALVMTADKSLRLPNYGGGISLVLGSTLIDRMTYGTEADGEQSLTRSPDGHGSFVPHTEAHAGLRFSPGTCTNGKPFGSGCLDEHEERQD